MKEEHTHEMNSIVPEHYFNLLRVICFGEIHFSSFTLPRQVRYSGLENKETEKKNSDTGETYAGSTRGSP